MRLRLGLGLHRIGVAGSEGAPPAITGIAISDSEIDDGAQVGDLVGTLYMVGGVEPATFTFVENPDDLWAIDGDRLEVDASLAALGGTTESPTVRVTDAMSQTFDAVIEIAIAESEGENESGIGEDDGEIVVPDDEDPEFDGGGFVHPPITQDTSDGLKITGKNGGSATFIFDWGVPEAGATVTMRYTADWSGMNKQGREAAVGFGFLAGNSFHLASLRGNGGNPPSMRKSKIYGDFRKANQFTKTDDGQAAHGTKDGPNWLQIEFSEDGETYTLRTSADGESWTDAYTDAVPQPLSEATDATTFGPAAAFTNSDKGVFSLTIEEFEAAAASPVSPVSAAVIPYLASISITTTDITASAFGGGTPVLAMFQVGQGTAAKTGVNDAEIGFGATDGANKWAHWAHSRDARAVNAKIDRAVSTTTKISLSQNGTVNAHSLHSTFLTNGERINTTDAWVGASLHAAIVLGGSGISNVQVGTVTPTTGGASVNLGWQPDVLIFSGARLTAWDETVGTGFNTRHGFAAWDSGGTLSEAAVSARSDTNTTSRLYRTGVVNNACIAVGTVDANTYDWTANVTRSGTGFTVTSSATAAEMGYIAIKLANGAKAKVGTWALPAGTGSSSVTGIGFKPKLVLLAGTDKTSSGNPSSGSMFGYAAMSDEPKAASVFASFVSDGTNSATDTRNVADNDGIYGLLGAGGADFDIEFTSMDTDGWTVNVTDAPAAQYLWPYLAIG